jgi:2-keto-4-pentenoate hydratase/2-oxohepta-3-ene-1,7-dioic acid hydratase in catechol pathway
MRFANLITASGDTGAVLVPSAGWVALGTLDPAFAGDLLPFIRTEPTPADLGEVAKAAAAAAPGAAIAETGAVFGPPVRHPDKVWGIGLNYREHAADLSESAPDEPASFIKGHHTIVGPGDDIVLPAQSSRVTSEAELGIIVGRRARNVGKDEALDYVFGVCPVLDQTAEDILQRNPRYLTRSKNFESFVSLGPVVVTLDEFLPDRAALHEIVVSTYVNDVEGRTNVIANMTHSPEHIISFHSAMMPLFPGDVLLTGTPGASVVSGGDVVEARISGLPVLRNPVRAAD